MSRFTEAEYVLTGLFKGGRPVVCLTSAMVYEVDYLGSGWRVAEGVGFCCDLASVPVLPRWIIRYRWGRRLWKWRAWVARRLARSAIPHDSCRQNPRRSKWWGDLVFFEAMGVDRVPLPLRLAAFGAALLNFSRD